MQQFGVQLTGVTLTIGYSVIVTLLLLVIVSKLVGFRLNEKREMSGLDQSLHGEHGYGMLNLS